MDFVGILKEAWTTTWRHKALWILGLFTAGSANVSSMNWTSGSEATTPRQAEYDLRGIEELPDNMERFARESVAWAEHGTVPDWLPLLLLGIALLIVIGIAFWVISFAAKGGIVEQTNQALAGAPVSARAGWRTGFRRWGRVFLVGLLLALPGLAIILVAGVVVGGIALLAAGTTMGSPDAMWPALLGLGALVPFVVLLLIVVAVIVGMISEVAYRRAILEDMGALDAVKASWADLRAKRGVATMWLVMLVVGIGAGVVSGLIMVPVLIVSGLITAAAYMGAGSAGLWVLVPLIIVTIGVGMLIKAVYATFTNTAWTSFYRRMNAPTEGVSETVQAPEPVEAPEPAPAPSDTPDEAADAD